MIGYDLDGTLCDPSPKRKKSYMKQTGEERRAYEAELVEHYANSAMRLQVQKPFVIITGRNERYRDVTEQWLGEHNLHPVELLMLDKSRNRKNMQEHKLNMCRAHDVSLYYEDDMKIAKFLVDNGINVVVIHA